MPRKVSRSNKVEKTAAPYPLDPYRIGELIPCIETLRRVHKLVEQHVQHLEEVKRKEIQLLFDEQSVLEDRHSPWYGFTHTRTENRLE